MKTKLPIRKILWLVIWAGIMLAQCNAPHDNPFDPKNPDADLGRITGKVETMNYPFSPLPDVSVYWQNDEVLVKTNDDGQFVIDNVHPRQGNLIFYKEGFSIDTVLVEWSQNNQFETSIRLNSIPVIDSLAIYTSVINEYNPLEPQEMGLYFSLSIHDIDRDVDSVYVKSEHFGFKHYLLYNVSTRFYEIRLSENALNVNSMRQIVGHTLDFYVVDRKNHTYYVGNGKAIRLILDEIITVSPHDDQLVSGRPTLIWEPFDPGFDFHYSIEIYKKNYPTLPHLTRDNISSDSTQYRFDSILSSGEYFWVIWCVDAFQNRSASKRASFSTM